MPTSFSRLFPHPASVVATIHTGPTPGAPGGCARPARQLECAVERAVAEARLYAELGVDGLLVENMHDVPWLPEAEQGPEVATFMTRVALQVKRAVRSLPIGVQVLEGADKTALAVALAAGCDFIRASGWTESAHAGAVLRYRRLIGAAHLPVWACIGPDASEAHLAARHRADVLVVTSSSGDLDMDDLDAVRETSPLPLVVGGDVDGDGLAEYAPYADAFVVGSAVKENGDWRAPICERRVRSLVGAVEYARGRENVSERY
jgi:predicted TIM-barrel enzyme